MCWLSKTFTAYPGAYAQRGRGRKKIKIYSLAPRWGLKSQKK
jgi:hypothetical protein